jgi:hypothetical protein
LSLKSLFKYHSLEKPSLTILAETVIFISYSNISPYFIIFVAFMNIWKYFPYLFTLSTLKTHESRDFVLFITVA